MYGSSPELHLTIVGPGRSGIVILDLNPDVGNFFEAWQKIRMTYPKQNIFYAATCYSASHQEWFSKIWSDAMTKAFTNGAVTIPGFSPKGSEAPSNLYEVPPAKPSLNLLTWMADDPNNVGIPAGVKVPQEMLTKWYQHEEFGKDFREFYDRVILECGIEEEKLKKGTPTKRKSTSGASGDALEEPPSKQQKKIETFSAEDMTGSPHLALVVLTSIKADFFESNVDTFP
jgi:hypothetical protein